MEYVVETEKEIVQNYIIKSKQERIEWELNHPQKRKDIIWHFHKPDIFKEACLHPVDYMDQEAMKNYLHKLSSAENVYFIGEDYIGEMSLEQAVERANEGEICIIYCGNGIGYYQGEQEKGAPPRFMLLAEKCYNTCIRGDLMLKREISERLYSWKNENKKKALCVIGARQIGKTTIIREFARKEYEYFVEVNFILDKGADQIFDGKLDKVDLSGL